MKFKKMSLFKKLVMANFFYAIPVVALVYLMYQAKQANIDFGAYELKGNRYQKSLESLLSPVLTHHALVARKLSGGSVSDSALTEAKSAVDRGFELVLSVNSDIGADLQFTTDGLGKRNRAHLDPSKVKDRWNNLASQWASMKPEDALAQHQALVTDLRGMITHVGDTSNLILDPDLDSYYLMDITLLAMPQNQERMQAALLAVEPILRRGSINPQERIDLAVLAALLQQSDLDRAKGDLGTVIQEDPNFYGESPTLKTKLSPALDAWGKSLDTFIATIKRISSNPKIELTPQEFVSQYETSLQANFNATDTAISELDILLNKRIDSLASNRNISFVVAALALLISCGLLFWVARDFNQNMTKVLHRLKSSVMETRGAGEKLVAVSHKLSEASHDQASAIQETVSTLDEINSMVKKTTESAGHSQNSAEESHETAVKGKGSVDEMSSAIRDISVSNESIMGQVERSNQQISEITKIIGEISTKTKVIHDIVFQTKLLSFNASVEAARAGEHGKGFAVVAEEVGNLAQMSGNAAKEIGTMLESSISKVESIVVDTKTKVESLIREGKTKVEAGGAVAVQCGRALEEIVHSVAEVKEAVVHINSAAEEQARGVSEITKAMQKLDDVTRQNTVMASETADYSSRLAVQGNELNSIVSMLEDEVLGTSLPAPLYTDGAESKSKAPLRWKEFSENETTEILHPDISLSGRRKKSLRVS